MVMETWRLKGLTYFVAIKTFLFIIIIIMIIENYSNFCLFGVATKKKSRNQLQISAKA